MRFGRGALLIAALAVAATSCGAGSRSAAPAPPTVRVVVTSGSHQLVFKAEVANTPGRRAFGLMNRTSVPPGTGMYFFFPGKVRASFYMKDTLVPLDIGWVSDGKLVEIAHMQPCVADPCPLWTPKEDYDGALETPVGGLTGVEPGATVALFGSIPVAS